MYGVPNDKLQAENIPNEPDPGNTGVGKIITTFISNYPIHFPHAFTDII